MHEDIVTTVLWGNEAIALIAVKPLYCSCNHGNTSVWLIYDGLQLIPGSNIAGVTAEKQEGTSELSTRQEVCCNSIVYTAFTKKAATMFVPGWPFCLPGGNPLFPGAIAPIRLLLL
jgi:hypothetical protein